MDINELKKIFDLAKKKLDDASNLLNSLNNTNFKTVTPNVREGINAVQTYITQAEEIINWLKQ